MRVTIGRAPAAGCANAVLTLILLTVIVPSTAFGQYIHFVAKAANGESVDVAPSQFEMYRAEIRTCHYQGDAEWLVAQRDPKSQLGNLPRLHSVTLIQHDIPRAELELISQLAPVEYVKIGDAPEGVRVEPESLCALADMQSLQEIDLCIADLTDRHLAFLSKCPRLEFCSFGQLAASHVSSILHCCFDHHCCRCSASYTCTGVRASNWGGTTSMRALT